jgi:hypothetical protein
MSQENVEILDAFYAAFNQRAFDDIVQCVDPNVADLRGARRPRDDAVHLHP